MMCTFFKTQETPDFGDIRELPDPEREAYVDSLKSSSAAPRVVNDAAIRNGVTQPLLASKDKQAKGNVYE